MKRKTKSRTSGSPAKGPKTSTKSRRLRAAALPSNNGDAEHDSEEAAEATNGVAQAATNGEAHAEPRRRATAQSMAAKQRDISVS